VASVSWTVAEYLTYWLRQVVREDRRPKTYQGYEGVVRLHLIPGLGRKQLAKLTAQEVRAFITRTRQECQCCKHGWDAQREDPRCCAQLGGVCCQSRLSARMVQSIHAVLRNALESAVREEIIPRNVAKLVQIPAPRYKINRGLTMQQAKATLGAAERHRLSALYVLALFLGLRRGELLGLRWQDVDLDDAKLEVVQTLQRSADRFASFRPRLRTPRARSRCHRPAWTRSASTASANSLSDPKHGRTGTIMAWSSRLGEAPRWNRTISVVAGARFGPGPVSARHAFMISAIPA
jgi:integrase